MRDVVVSHFLDFADLRYMNAIRDCHLKTSLFLRRKRKETDMNIGNRLIALMTAFLIVISPLQQTLIVSADEDRGDIDLSAETAWSDVSGNDEKRDAGGDRSWKESVITEGSEDPEENEEIIGIEATEATEATEEPLLTEMPEENGSIVTALSPDEYFKLVSEIPDCERIIVDTYEDLSDLKVSYGVYYDGTYILGFEDHEEYNCAVKKLSDMDLKYAADGTVSLCGDADEMLFDIRVNPDAAVRVAVIDTGSDLANENYTILGDDAGDHNGHGTAMSSYLLNETDNAYIISIKAIGDNGQGNISDVYAAVQMAEDLGVDYILMAVSIRNTGKFDAFRSLIENTNAVVVASAGNNGSDASLYLPAGVSGVITVGALNDDCALNEDSNYGECVDYYVKAGSTSEAASTALGVIIDGRQDELPSEYFDVGYFDEQYHLILKAEGEDAVFTTDNVHDQNITVYEPDAYWLPDLFTSSPEKYVGVFSDTDSATMNSHILYCAEDTKEAPSDNDYGMKDWRNNTDPDEPYNGGSSLWIKQTQAACAFGPAGSLYSYGSKWWKENDTSGVIKNKNNTSEMKKAMYVITHLICCKAYSSDGSWPDSTPDSLKPLLNSYLDYIMSVRNGETAIQGYTLSDWWCEFYRCWEFGEDGVWSNTYGKIINNATFQIMTRGNVTKKAIASDINVTVEKSSDSITDPDYIGFEGATYTLYQKLVLNSQRTGFELKNELTTFVMNEDGTTDTIYQTTRNGNSSVVFYLKETQAAAGYELDDTVYQIRIEADNKITVGVMDPGGRLSIEDPDKVTVTDDTVDIIHVKDKPDKAVFRLEKKLGENYSLLAGQTYSFELWDSSADICVAKGSASVPSDANGSTVTPVRWTDIADGYSPASGNRIVIKADHEYQVMETTLSVDGRDLETPAGWTKGKLHGKECFYCSFTSEKGRSYSFTAVNVVSAILGITKTSSDTVISDGNACYSYAGAQYVLSTDYDFNTSNIVGTFTMKSDGTTDTKITVARDSTYYLKETVAGAGYELDTSVYKIVIGSDAKASVSTFSGDGEVTVTDGNIILVNVKDSPRTTKISVAKSSADPSVSGANDVYDIAGATYELYSNPDGTGKVCEFVIKSDGTADNSYATAYGKTYYLKETKAGKGFELDDKTYTVTVGFDGNITVNNGAEVDNSGTVKITKVTDVPKTAKFSLSKKLGTNATLLAGQNFVFELWDKTANKKVATGVAAVPADASSTAVTPVAWSDVSAGYSLLSNNQLRIIPEHSYQIRETTTLINGRVLNCPAGWTKYKDEYFYLEFSAGYGQIYAFEAVNSTTVELSITKASADKAVTDGNKAYDLAGAKYDLSTVADFSSTVGTFTMRSDGTADKALNVTCGTTYYLKETAAAAGYELDTSVYKIVIGPDAKADVSTYSGSGKADVKDGNLILINVKDQPRTVKISVSKSSSDPSASGSMPNDVYDIAGATYELYTNPDGTGKVCAFVMKSDGTTDASYTTAYGKTYYLKETKAGKGFELDATVYNVTVGFDGNITVNNGATVDNSGAIKIAKVTDVPMTAKFSLMKKLGTNASLLAGQDYNFELWDTTANDKAATGIASVSADADASTSTPVVWTNVAAGYSAIANNQLVIIPEHSYQIRETTTSINGRSLNCPLGWTQSNDGYFYLDFKAGYGQTYSFEAVNSTTVQLSITKSSADHSVTDGNKSYNLAGAKYELASDAEFSTVLGSFTMRSDGTADKSLTVICGTTYYLKETVAAKGYLLDTSIYKIVIGSDAKATVSTLSGKGVAAVTDGDPIFINVKDQPETTYISLTKVSANADITNGNGCYSLAGTAYGLYINAEDAENGKNALTVFSIAPDGKAASVYKTAYGITYYLKEISAGQGYELDEKVYKITVDESGKVNSDNGIKTSLSGGVYYIRLSDTPVTEKISWSVIKNDPSGWNTVTDKTLAGAVFRVEYFDRTDVITDPDTDKLDKASPKVTVELTSAEAASGSKIDVSIDTLADADKSGYFKSFWSLGGLPLGTFRVTEIKAPDGYSVVSSPVVFYIACEGGKAKTGIIVDASVYNAVSGSEVIMKEPALIGFYAPSKAADSVEKLITGLHDLDGTKYGIYYRNNNKPVCTVEFNAGGSVSDVIYSSGIRPSKGWEPGEKTIELAAGDYYAKELSAGKWFFLDGASYGFSIEAGVTSNMEFKDIPVIPKISTTAADSDTGNHNLSFKDKVTIKDVVSYEGLVPDEEYVLTGALYDAGTGEPYKDADGNTYIKTVSFTPDRSCAVIENGAASGETTVVFEDVMIPLDEITLVVFEKLYKDDLLIASHEDLSDMDQTVTRHVPELGTTATDAVNGTHIFTYEEKVSVKDEVRYKNLNAGETYCITGTLIDADTGRAYTDGEGRIYKKTFEFTASEADGTETVVFDDVIVPMTKTTIVVFEELYEKTTGNRIAVHADIKDKNQTVRRPAISTTAVDADTGTHFSSYKDRVTINDNVVYENLTSGEEYVITGTLYDAGTGEVYEDSEGNTYTKSVVFRPEESEGHVTVPFEDVMVPAEGKTVVVFERLYEKRSEELIALHEDINYKGQSVERRVPELGTNAVDTDTGTHFMSYKKSVSITDKVSYTNLNVGEEYIVTGTLYDASTGEVYKDPEGNSYTKSVVFKPAASDGQVDVLFEDVFVPLEKTLLVVFEDLYESETNNKIASHADLYDEDQTVERRVPELHTTATDAVNGTHTFTYEKKVSLYDVVTYTNLNIGEAYYITGTLFDADTGKLFTDAEGKTYTKTVEFTAPSPEGEIVMTFEDVLVPFEKTTIVVFEELFEKTTGAKIATHADLKDENQTVRRPAVGTVATVLNAKEIWLGSTEVTDITITDTVFYEGFECGRTYRAEAVLYKSDGTQIMSDGQPVMSAVSFVPVTPGGEIKVDITFSSEGLEEGDRIVVFEKIYDVATDKETVSEARAGDILVARHEDLNNEDQTVTIHFRPMTGGIVTSYSVAGNVIASVSAVVIGAWFFISRRKKYGVI